MINLWEKVGTACLDKAMTLLEKETIPTAATVEMVRALVEAAVSIDSLNLRWEAEIQCGAPVSPGHPFRGDKQETESRNPNHTLN